MKLDLFKLDVNPTFLFFSDFMASMRHKPDKHLLSGRKKIILLLFSIVYSILHK